MTLRTAAFTALLLMASAPCAQSDTPAPALPLYAVEFTTGSAWDAAKPPHEQAQFAAHSANLKALREAGQLVLGARYADKGLVVISAADEARARALIEQDPAVQAKTFAYQLHEFRVFYGGSVAPPRKKN